jgi:hypothetical protein
LYSPTGQQIYDEVEATYKASLLIKKANSYNNPEVLLQFHEMAVNTLEVLTLNMIATDISLDKIYEYYKEINRKNVIKLLLRCRKMYEARTEVKKIFKLIIKKERLGRELDSIKAGISQHKRKPNSEESSSVFFLMQLIERVKSSVTTFLLEHKIFKGSFIFRREDYVALCTKQCEDLLRFIEQYDI